MRRLVCSLLLTGAPITLAVALRIQAQTAAVASAGGPANVLLIVNDKSPESVKIGEYYAQRRGIPAKNICRIHAPADESIDRADYNRLIGVPVTGCLRKDQLQEQILYIATTLGVPLRVSGGSGTMGDVAAVDSELALLYDDMKQGRAHPLNGPVPNPFFGKGRGPFNHAEFPMYLVTRLAAYDVQGVKDMIDRSLAARDRGKFVIDLRSAEYEEGNNWLHAASTLLPQDRLALD